ncbi:SusC/RagA family TonB-linked outer membrane protein [Ornithobacterium rhinotracheale]|uniref:SusC/RagA family TonB-linked outer membrane protein n=1 Tax=Ornithobacterium rhinotracheale TaxID=28251 RepID=UPI004035E534
MTIEGTVTSAEGYPEADAIVRVEGTKGAFTDLEGKFQLKVEPNQVVKGKVIVVAEAANGAIQTKRIKYKAGSVLKNNFKLGSIALEEVVAIGYGSARKKDLTGSIISIKPDKNMAATATSIDNLLQGQAAGVSVTTGGSTPGAAASVIIRGANSLTGDSQPLYIIDNVPQPSAGQSMRSASGDFQLAQDPLAGINPNDIEDIQILKDASATAIYGSRGANGVIIVTTKKGKTGKPKFTFSMNTTIAEAIDLIPLMNLEQYARYMNNSTSEKKYDIRQDGVYYTYKAKTESGNTQDKTVKIFYRDWLNEALRKAYSNVYNFNVNGGSDKVRYNLSVGYKDVEGIVRKTGFRHGDFRLNLGADLSEKLKMNINVSGFLRKNNMMPGGNTTGRTTGAIIPTAMNSQPFILPSDDEAGISEKDFKDANSTVFSWINDFDDINKEYKFSLSGDATYKFNDKFSYTFRAAGNKNHLEKNNWFGIELFRGYIQNGVLTEGNLERDNYNVENLVNYNQKFGNLNFSATAGVTYEAYKWLDKSLVANGFPHFYLRTNGISIAENIKVLNPIQKDYQLLSYLGRVNLSFFDGRYLLTGSFRADGTSKFAKDNRWAYFPSFAAAWNVKEEEFLKLNKTISQLKLRGGWGITGSQNIDPYGTIFSYVNGVGYADSHGKIEKGLRVERINNPDLKWETTSSYNAGLDFGFVSNRIRGSVDVYRKLTSDLLINLSLSGSSSFNTFAVNNGEISNKGVEAMLNLDVLKSKDFIWTIGGNIAFNKSNVEKLGVPTGTYAGIGTDVRAMYGNTIGDHFGAPNIFVEGMVPGLFYGYVTDGLVQEVDLVEYTALVRGGAFTETATAGAIKYVDVNKDGKIDINDKVIIGDPNPDFTYGMNTSFKYKGFRLSAQFQGVKGGDILNTNVRYREMAVRENGGRNIIPEAAEKAWTPSNPNTKYPAFKTNIQNVVIDRYLQDASYLRCTDITLGYNIASKVLEQLKLNNLDFFVSVKNAFTITNYSGFDPATRSFGYDPLIRGVDLYSFPLQRAYIMGVTINF